MPRDGSGVYTLPAGNPVVTNTVIASAWANSTLSDIAAQLNNVFTRDGLLGPTGPFKIMDGTVAAPGLAWNSEPGLGWYRPSASQIATASNGAKTSGFDTSNGAATLYSLFPRTAGGESDIILYNQPSGTAVTQRLQLGAGAAGAFIYAAGIGGGAKPTLSLDAATFAFSGFSAFNIGDYSAGVAVAIQGLATGGKDIYGKSSGSNRWLMRLGDGTAADDFLIWRYNDAGVLVDNPFKIVRGTGVVAVSSLSASGTISATGNISSNNGVVAGGNFTSVSGGLFLDNGGQTALIGINQSGGFPKLRWTGDNWRLEWAGGNMRYYDNNSRDLWSILSGGNMTIAGDTAVKLGGTLWSNPSDERIKTNIRDYTAGLDQILALRPVLFDLREETGIDLKDSISLIAQEAELVMPVLVKSAPGKIGTIEYEDMRTLDASPVMWALVNAVKTLNSRIAALEAV